MAAGGADLEVYLAAHLTEAAAWAAVAALHNLRGDLTLADEAWAEAWRLSGGTRAQAALAPCLESAQPLTVRYLWLREREATWAPGPLLGLWRHLLAESGDREEWLAAVERLRPRVRSGSGSLADLPSAARLALPALAVRQLGAERLDDAVLATAFASVRHEQRRRHAATRRGLSMPQPSSEDLIDHWRPRAEALYAELAEPYRRGVLAAVAV